jgi:hypothetical protein
MSAHQRGSRFRVCFSIVISNYWLKDYVPSDRFSSACHSKQYDNNGNHQKNMNKTACGVGGDQSQEPQYEQNNSDGIEHDNYPFVL